MNNFLEATKQQLRINTKRGPLSVEQLWTLPVKELDELAVSLEEEHENSGRKSFLVKRSVKDKTAKLKFEIVLEILQTKVEDQEAAATLAENKAFNQKLDELIANKKDDALSRKSITELEKMRK